MKTESIRIGTPCRYDRKYMDGRLVMRVPVLEGESEEVEEAEDPVRAAEPECRADARLLHILLFRRPAG